MISNSEYKELKRRLKKSSSYKQLSDLICSIILSESRLDYYYMKKSLSSFKQLLSEIVDSAWSSSKIIENSMPRPIKHTRHITSVPKLRPRKISENQLAWSSETINKSSHSKDAKSDFSYVKGPASFAKSIREIHKPRAPSPGPTCYYFEALKNKSRSPRIIFPKSSQDRNSYVPISVSPGPSKYYPSLHNVVKFS